MSEVAATTPVVTTEVANNIADVPAPQTVDFLSDDLVNDILGVGNTQSATTQSATTQSATTQSANTVVASPSTFPITITIMVPNAVQNPTVQEGTPTQAASAQTAPTQAAPAQNAIGQPAPSFEATEDRIIAHFTKLLAEAVTDIRKGDANTVTKLSELTNAVLSLKNTVSGLATALADIKKSPYSNAKANIYVAKTASAELPVDLFNAKPTEDANCD